MRFLTAIFLGVIVVFSSVCLFYPLGNLFLVGGKHVSWNWGDSEFWRIVAFTYTQAFASALLSAVVGIWGAFLYSEQTFWWRRFLWRVSLVCFSLPAILAVLSFVGFWRGILGESWYGWLPILLVHCFFNFSLFLRNVGNALLEMDRAPEKTALSLGATRVRCFFSVTLSRLLPTIKATFWIAFLYCTTSFLVVMLLGGGPRFTTIEVAIYSAVKIDLDIALASKLALFQLLVAILVSVIFLRGSSLTTALSTRESFTPLFRFFDERKNRIVRGLYAAVLAIVVLGPLVSLLVAGASSIASVTNAELLQPLSTSLKLGLLAGAFSVILAFPFAYVGRRLPSVALKTVANLPLSLSAILLTLAWMLVYSDFLFEWRGSLLAIALMQAIGSLPLTFATLSGGFSRVSEDVLRSSWSLGAGPMRTLLFVELPLLKRSLLSAFLLGVAFSFGEAAAVMMFLSESVRTLPVTILGHLGRYDFDGAYAVGIILLLLLSTIQWMGGRLET